MKKLFLALLVIVVSLNSFGQGTSVQDTAAQRKEQEAANKFVSDLVSKTTIKDFQAWVYENLPAKKHDEFIQLYNYFIQQKYIQSKGKK